MDSYAEAVALISIKIDNNKYEINTTEDGYVYTNSDFIIDIPHEVRLKGCTTGDVYRLDVDGNTVFSECAGSSTLRPDYWLPAGKYHIVTGSGGGERFAIITAYLPVNPEKEEPSYYLTPLEDKLDNLITYITENPTSPEATEPQTVEWDAGDSLPLGIMKQLQETPNVSLLFSFTYEGVDHKVLIPAGGAFVDEDITWYGPLWLLGKYGEYDPHKKEYTIESGDNLKALAKKFGMSLEELIAKNPQIKDSSKIYPGQVINY